MKTKKTTGAKLMRIVFAAAVLIRDRQSLSEFHSEQAIAHQRNLNRNVEVFLFINVKTPNP
ncbi:hypothetical protein BTO13_00085 [Polaribacter gangjinensis]|uniref:Uncharacterized protein n=1 Tax=Polaribacter gangjinensis TaxID=574710 RepID=A0A2S7W814_9FLAO|nr:hypothetical protein BTO13_00085 [Polaribacter gangjinensis]